jgi:hypothetical protein
VIRIRYSSELQPGLHGRVDRHGRVTSVYLLPGLTPPQRRAALRRMRQQGRMGICPRLPAAQLAAALFADRVRAAFGQAGAIVRVHPAGSTLPVMAVSVAITSFFVLSALSVHIVHLPPQAIGSVAAGSAPGAGPSEPLPAPGGGQPTGPFAGRGKSPAGSGGISPTPSGAPVTSPVTGPATGQSTGPSTGSGPGTAPGTGTSQSPAPGGSQPSPGGSTPADPAGTTPPPQQPTPAASGSSSSAPAPTPSPSSSSPAATSTGSGNPKGQVCVDVGALGICLGW